MPAKEPKQTPTTTNAPARGDARPEPVTAIPGWSPAPAQSAPGLDAKRGPDAFYALAGPSPDLAAQARERALVWLRAEFGDQPIDEAMVLAEHKEDPTGLAWLHYGAHEWSQGDFALAIRGADGWFATLPIAASSKHAPLRVDGPIVVSAVELGPDGRKATEYTVAFVAGVSPGPFTVKMVCLDAPVPACTRPWAARVQGPGKQPDLRFESAAIYRGDGTIRVEKRSWLVGWTDAPDWPWRPYAVVGTFTPK